MAIIGKRLAVGAKSLGPVDVEEMVPANLTQCGAIDALRPYRADIADGAMSLSANAVLLRDHRPACLRGGMVDVSEVPRNPTRELALLSLQPDGQLLQIFGSRTELEQLVRKNVDGFSATGDGAFHASVCYTMAGSAALFMVESKEPVDFGLRTGVATRLPADFARRLADQSHSKEMRVSVGWLSIDGSEPATHLDPEPRALLIAKPTGSPDPAPRVQPAFVTSGERTKEQAAINTADFNRRELERIKASTSRVVGKSAEHATCRAFVGSWKDVGRFGREQCLSMAMRGRCQVSYAMYKNRLFRRRDGHIQEQRGSRWQDAGVDSGC